MEEKTMKHFTPITVLKAHEAVGLPIISILERVFGFVLELADIKQKSPQPL